MGEPYAAKWQPRGGERLIKMAGLEREGKTEECGQQGKRKSVCEHERDSFETRSSVAKLSERRVSHRADET